MNQARILAIRDVFSVAVKILKLRKACGMTQSQLAEHCDVTPARVSDWESGISLPGAIDCLSLAEIAGLNECDFWIELSGFTHTQLAFLTFIKPVTFKPSGGKAA